MTEYKTGLNRDYFWIEFSGNSMTLYDILNRCSSILQNKFLAIICFDSGPLRLVSEEKALGWYEKEDIAYSPQLTEDIIAELPTEQFDQWCLFRTPTEISKMTKFVNYAGFKIASGRQKLVEADSTWDRAGIEKQIEVHDQLVAQFWDEVLTINPTNLILNGDNLIFVTKEATEIELIKRTAANMGFAAMLGDE